MSMSVKKAIIVIIALIVVALVAYVLLRGGSSSNKPVPIGQGGSLPGVISNATATPSFFAANVSSGTSVGSVSVVDASPIVAYFVSTSSAVTVVQTDGEIVALAGGQATALSSSSISNLVAAGFSHDGKKIVVSSGSVGNPQAGVFDVATQSWTSLGMGIVSPAWAPSGERLAYLRDSGNGSETVVTADFSKPKPSTVALGTVSLQDMRLAWIDGNNLALVSRPSAYVNGSALIFNVVKKTLAPIVVDRPGFTAIWNVATSSPMGLVFSAGQSQRGGHLQLVDLQGDVLQNMSFLTLPTKCVFAMPPQALSLTPVISTSTIPKPTSTVSMKITSTTKSSMPATSNQQPAVAKALAGEPATNLYCAVPRDQTTLSYYDLPDAYEQHQIFTSDDLYSVNIMTGHIDTIFSDQTQNFDMSNVSIVGNSLFFVNRYDSMLYAIKIQ